MIKKPFIILLMITIIFTGCNNMDINQGVTTTYKKISAEEAKILVYCRSGNRSATASKQLIKMGYTNVYDFGGIISWPYEIVK